MNLQRFHVCSCGTFRTLLDIEADTLTFMKRLEPLALNGTVVHEHIATSVLFTMSFEDLVRKYAGDVPARALLEELVRVNAAIEMDDGYVRLLNRTYVPSPLDPVGLERLGNVVNYFIDTVGFNLQKKRQGQGRFERYAMTIEGLSEQAFQRFDALIREKGQELLEVLDDWLGENETKGGHKLPPTEAQDGRWNIPFH